MKISEPLTWRLAALKARGAIANWQHGHPSTGLSKAMLPAAIIPKDFGPAMLYYDEHTLTQDVTILETMP